MQYNKVSEVQIKQFKSIVGEPFVIIGNDNFEDYNHDHTEDLRYYPEVVVKPKTSKEISEILVICNQNHISVTPRGAGTGLSGGALPIHGGVLIAMERLNQIIDIDERNFQVTVEPGVINEVLQNAVKEKGLFYPPDPA
ncbi:MAG: FAD-binding oxidoreductase, partial [Bacteroidetes bacterium]|nr:FAD-binding oxidoreductase [Bacteroidota bacterium]